MELNFQGRCKQHLPFSFKAIYLVFLFLSFSCIRETEIDLINYYSKKPVIYSIISLGEDINVLVSETLTFGYPADSIRIINNAIVELAGNNSTVLLTFNHKKNVYSVSHEKFPLKIGDTYDLKVIFPDGTESFSTTTIPNTYPQWVDINYNLADQIPDGTVSFRFIEFYFYWLNEKEDNYNYLVYSNDIIRSSRTGGNNYVFPDGNANGSILWAYFLDLYSHFSSMETASVSLVKVTSGFRQFHQYERQLQEISDNLDMGLFWELYRGIIPEYTNIDGGYGFFGSYLKTDTVIHF